MTSKTPKQDQVQGEGDYEAGRRYDKAARDAAPDSAAEAEQMQQAEEAGKSHSKGEGRLVSDKRKS